MASAFPSDVAADRHLLATRRRLVLVSPVDLVVTMQEQATVSNIMMRFGR